MKRKFTTLVLTALLIATTLIPAGASAAETTAENVFIPSNTGLGELSGRIIDGYHTYCIDETYAWPTNTTKYEASDLSSSEITDDQIEKLKRALEAGYPNDAYGFGLLEPDSAIRAYFTQKAVWSVFDNPDKPHHTPTANDNPYYLELYNYVHGISSPDDEFKDTAKIEANVEVIEETNTETKNLVTFDANKAVDLTVKSIPESAEIERVDPVTEETTTITTEDVLSVSDELIVTVDNEDSAQNKDNEENVISLMSDDTDNTGTTDDTIEMSYESHKVLSDDSFHLFTTDASAGDKPYQRMLGYGMRSVPQTLSVALLRSNGTNDIPVDTPTNDPTGGDTPTIGDDIIVGEENIITGEVTTTDTTPNNTNNTKDPATDQKAVQTGDSLPLGILLILMTAAAAGILTLVLTTKKRKAC
ncbi:MAG: thioester domain-containing protein [Bacillota bacterium]|nr:thioester domain-containing protein [Bacillota bacterium]